MPRIILFLLIVFFFVFCLTGFGFAQQPLEIEYPEVMGETPTPGLSFPEYIRYIFLLSLTVGGFIAFGVIIFGGFRFLTSANRPAVVADAKDQISAGILGLFVLFCSWLILYTLNPQLLILKLPGLGAPRIGEIPVWVAEKESLAAEEIPFGALINSQYDDSNFYSDYQGVLHPKRQERVKTVARKAKEATEKLTLLMGDLEKESKILTDYGLNLKDHAEQLKNYANNCQCSNCSKCCDTSGCGNCACNCRCSGDPCRNRAQMENLRNNIIPRDISNIQNQKPIVEEKKKIVDLFTGAFEAFVKKNKKVEDFINENATGTNALSPDLQKIIYEMKDLENTTSSTYTLSNGSLFSTPAYYYQLKYRPEEENDIENNKLYFEKAIGRLTEAKMKMKNCSNRGDLIGYNNFYEWKGYKEGTGTFKEIEIVHWEENGGNIIAGLDLFTFYCSKYGPAVILTQEGTYCTTEIQTGQAIDEAEDLGLKILNELTAIFNNSAAATNNGFTAAAAAEDEINEASLETSEANKLIGLASPGNDRTKDCVDSCPSVPCASSCVTTTGGCCETETVCSGEGEEETCTTYCVKWTKFCRCQTCAGPSPCPITEINNSFNTLNSHYNKVNGRYNQIKTAYDYIKNTCQPNIQESYKKINSEKKINGFKVGEKINGIQTKLAKIRRQLDECFASVQEWTDYYQGRITIETLVDCETAKSEYLKEENLVNNCYGFDIEHPDRTDNLLCCESE